MNVEIKLTNNEMLNNFDFENSDNSELKYFVAIWIRMKASKKHFNPKNYMEFNNELDQFIKKWIKKLEND